MEQSEKAHALYDPERYREDAFLYSQNPGVAIQCHAAWVRWFLGQPDQALAAITSALTLARDLSEPHGLAHSFFFAAILHQLRREPQLVQEYAESSIAVSGEHGLALYRAHATIARGWALVEQGIETEGIDQIRQGLTAHQATNTKVMRPHFLALLAEALGKTGQAAAGLDVLEEALSLCNRTGERYYQAEIYRLKGELLLAQSGSEAAVEAEDCFHQSIKIAQQQKAKSWELRAATSLAQLRNTDNTDF